jgi:hypothetical protein
VVREKGTYWTFLFSFLQTSSVLTFAADNTNAAALVAIAVFSDFADLATFTAIAAVAASTVTFTIEAFTITAAESTVFSLLSPVHSTTD